MAPPGYQRLGVHSCEGRGSRGELAAGAKGGPEGVRGALPLYAPVCPCGVSLLLVVMVVLVMLLLLWLLLLSLLLLVQLVSVRELPCVAASGRVGAAQLHILQCCLPLMAPSTCDHANFADTCVWLALLTSVSAH